MRRKPHVLLVHSLFFTPRGPDHLHDIREGFSEKTLKALTERYPDRSLLVLTTDDKLVEQLTAHDVQFLQWDHTHVIDSLARLVDSLRALGVVATLPLNRSISYMHIEQHVTFGEVTWIGRHDHTAHGIPLDKELTVAEMQLARASTARW